MTKIGIIICARYQSCGGGKCLRALKEREGAFSIYSPKEEVELVGYSSCGGCPGGNVEYVPEEMIKNKADVIHLATGLVVGYPPCSHIKAFKAFIESKYHVKVVVGTHPIPMKYATAHKELPFWDEVKMDIVAPELFHDNDMVMKAYD